MIKKIDDDHYEVVTETTQTLCLSELEEELSELKEFNRQVELAEIEVAKLPKSIQATIQCLNIMDTSILEIQINELKSI